MTGDAGGVCPLALNNSWKTGGVTVSFRWVFPIVALAVRLLGADPQLGDLDGDGRVTVLDVVKVVELSRSGGLGATDLELVLADVNRDGVVNDADAALVASAAAGANTLPPLPLLTIRNSSPAAGEDGVSVTRESVFYLTLPLAPSAVVNIAHLHADLGARKILSRVEVASDHRTVTLFYLEPLPGNARVRVTFDGTGLTDFLGRPVDLDGDGTAGGTHYLDFGTLALAPVPDTRVTGRVFASEIQRAQGAETNMVINTPLGGVTVTVDGMEESMRAVTDAQGNFQLNPVPAGAFFVHIDGRTVTNLVAGIRYPDQAYYPFVGKRWVSVAGQQTSIGDVFLPLIVAGTLKSVVPGSPTVVTFPPAIVAANPVLAGVTLQVPADSLFSENGVRGGRIGIAPVSPDRLPGPLPPGVNPALVITVQTDGGGNFDRPVPICFPNLPDPVTGEILPPGAKSALWSFNHDTGRFEIVGPMTVSDDGKQVCTDPGVGVLAPGWHFSSINTLVRGLGIDCDPTGAPSSQGPPSQSRPPGKPGTPKGPCDEPRSHSGAAGDPVQLYSGEMVEEVIDLYIPGRGFDFNWQRTYRSRTGPKGELGNGWDHPYRVFLVAAGNDLVVYDGNGRGDAYAAQANQTWAAAGLFRTISRGGDGTLSMLFEDRGQWVFHALDAGAMSGRLVLSVDRNGNRMAFAYDANGRLSKVNDTLGRDIAVAYNADGYIESVTDFAGRSVRYAYYKDGDAGGGAGDLKSVTGPAVTGTPNGNDFPAGKTTTYTYTTGFADDRLNHNLLTVTDGRRNDPNDPTVGTGPYLTNVYSTATDPGDPDFDRVVRQTWGGGIIDFVYVPMLPAEPNGFAVMRAIVNDRVGNVSENFFDAGNRLVRRRVYTGRAAPDHPTTALDNRPVNPVRATDPEYYETVYQYNPDSLPRLVTYPNGNMTQYVYESDLNPGADPRVRGNRRIVRHLPGSHLPAGDQAVIEEAYEYGAGFAGCCGDNFITKETDGRGNVTLHAYDDRGNRIRSRFAVAGVVDEWEFNGFGQVTAHVAPPDAAGNRRRDEVGYYDSGPQTGYQRDMIVDAGGLKLTTTLEYDAVGNVVRSIDPRGNDSRRTLNPLNQLVRIESPEVVAGGGIRYRKDFYYDANNNLVRQDTRNLDENGAVQTNADFTTRFEYDALNVPVRISQEIDDSHSIVTEYVYDANRNRVLERNPEAVAGRQPANVVRIVYDERDMPYQVISAPGDPSQSTTRNDYDANGNLTRTSEGIESGARVTVFEHDGYERLVAVTDAMGNRQHRQYDAAYNLVHAWAEGELADVPGSAKNVRMSESTQTYDALNRPVRSDRAHFDAATQQPVGDGQSSTVREYTLTSQLSRVSNDNGHETRFAYDGAHRLKAVTDAKGDTLTRAYDAAGNLVSVSSTEISDVGATQGTFATSYQYDNLNRAVRITDNAGNVFDVLYDSRNQPVVSLDGARANPSAAGNRTRRAYDGLGRLVRVTRELTTDGTGAGSAAGQIVLRREWDDDSRPTARLDGNGNATRYLYDPLDRVVRSVIASGAVATMQYDAHSDAVSATDPNGTVVARTFDALGRVVRKDIIPGAGVASDTTFEEWDYDGLSRLVRAANDASRVDLGYDSLDNLTLDSVDGRAVVLSHDGVGNAVGVTYPGGRKIKSTFDSLEQLAALTDATSAVAVPIAGYDYAGPGRVARRSNGNNTRMDASHDALKREVRTTHARVGGAAFEDREYAWDANSNQTLNRDRLAGGLVQSFAYDSAYRLRSATYTGSQTGQRGFQYDGAGNRLAVTGSGDAGSYAFDVASGDAVSNQYTATPFDQRAYDPNGNLRQVNAGGEARRLEFDYLDRLVRLESGGTTNRYAYDALGRRVARSTDGGIVRYSYMGARAVEEQDDAGNILATYVYGSAVNDVVSMRRGGKDYWLHEDDQSSIRRVTDSSGIVVESYQYDEFGNPAMTDGAGHPIAGSVVGNPHLYTGNRYDPESGFYYALHRYYEPRTGRFITRDPSGAFGDPMGLGNAFTYAGNNPATFVDPVGLAGQHSKAASYAPKVVKGVAKGLAKYGDRVAGQAANALAEGGKALGEADRINTVVGNELLGWVEGHVAGTIANADEKGNLIYEALSTEDAAAAVNLEYGRTYNPFSPGDTAKAIGKNGRAPSAAKGFWYKNATEDIANLENKAASLEADAARLARRASKFKTAGKVVAVVGVAIQAGMAMKEDYDNCAGAGFIANDGLATGGAALAVNAVPPLGVADLLTGGAVSGGIHNAAMIPTVAAHMAGRMTQRDAKNIKSAYTRFAVGRWAWDAGEWWANALMGE